ncbi:hypothetical protein D9758_005502 [Tetrapyrgos nigripes]|uniref:F-box domain-containing protein n=1 Tax=Tetrapyrgos nigripes TaxID=182062 RepID=A0A8H5GGT7_9AGAR|nr:hypothetical protein D9758_005502 [Tetrapyrgos nigripes]
MMMVQEKRKNNQCHDLNSFFDLHHHTFDSKLPSTPVPLSPASICWSNTLITMICSSCGASKLYTNHFDITDASARVTQMLRIFPIPISSSSVVSQMQVDIESDMRHYDLEMSQLQSRLVYLQAKQELLSKHVEQLKSLSAPIRRLPVELLARIFVMVCEEDAITFSLHAQIAWRLPFVLASVCSGWRGVAVATSRLWSNLCTFWTTKPTAPRLEPPLKLCLLRSQNHPLSVELRIEPSEGPDDPTLQMLTEQCSRWKHVTVLNLVEENFPGLSNGRSFPLLETLEITHYDSESEHPDLHLFSSAPRLHTLKINKLPPPETLETFTPCAQIISLTVSCFYDFFEVLNKFSSLKSMIFADVDHSYIPEPEELPLQTLP